MKAGSRQSRFFSVFGCGWLRRVAFGRLDGLGMRVSQDGPDTRRATLGFAQRRQGPRQARQEDTHDRRKPLSWRPRIGHRPGSMGWQLRSARLGQRKPLQRGPVQEALIRSDDHNARNITVMQNQTRWRRVVGKAERQKNTKRFAWSDFI